MKRSVILRVLSVVLLVCAPTAFAQIYKNITIENSGLGVHVIPAGNTVNDKLVVFYAHSSGTIDLKTRLVNADGTLGPIRLIAGTISVTEPKRFDVAWNPRSKSYLVVYAKGGKLWGRKVSATGAPTAAAKEITNYTGRFWTVTASAKKRFALLLSRGGNLVVQVLRATGKKRKGEAVLDMGGKAGNFPLDSVSAPDGTAFVTFARYVAGSSSTELRLLRFNKKLNILGSSLVGVFGGLSSTLIGSAYCAYDPDDDVYAITWRFGNGTSEYCIVNSSEYYVQPPTATPTLIQPRELVYNVAKGQFMIHFQRLNYFSGIDHTEYYYTPIWPTGAIAATESFLVQHNYENDGSGFGVSGVGTILVAWTPESGTSGIFGKMVIF